MHSVLPQYLQRVLKNSVEQLTMPVITYVTSVTAEADKISAVRDVGDSLVTVETGFPVLITATKELNEPRLPNMMQILQAANKKIETWSAGDLGVSGEQLTNKMTTAEIKGFQMNRKNIMIEGEPEDAATQLMDHLKTVIGS
jgi:electron transfer flavoprotein beta subunit